MDRQEFEAEFVHIRNSYCGDGWYSHAVRNLNSLSTEAIDFIIANESLMGNWLREAAFPLSSLKLLEKAILDNTESK
jgi:hypothetical protein